MGLNQDEIQVQTKDGVVTLNGEVNTWHKKYLAEDLISSIKGIRKLNNEIQIKYDEKINDSAIREAIDHRLTNDPWVFEKEIEVTVKKGDVSLFGTVRSAYEKSQAYIDSWVDGVVGE